MASIKKYYTPHQTDTFKLSRSKVDDFFKCPRCFWLNAVKGIAHPPGLPFSLNVAVDGLFKKEFDYYREKKLPHPLFIENNLQAIPYQHPELNNWRENFKGIRYIHPETNFELTGAVDDVWITPVSELLIADYKATAKESEVTLDADWQIGYKRQMEFYQWLFRMKGFKVNDTGYFVYTNGIKTNPAFNDTLKFRTKLIPYIGNDSWVIPTLNKIKLYLDSSVPPPCSNSCEHCKYYANRKKIEYDIFTK